MRLYLDVCCINRPFDDQSQERIRLEAEAVKFVLDGVSMGQYHWISSGAIDFEVRNCRDATRRLALQVLLELASETVALEEQVIARAESLAAANIRGVDTIHLALAEQAGCDVFLTTDEKLLRRAHRLAGMLRIRVVNPIEWVDEVHTL